MKVNWYKLIIAALGNMLLQLAVPLFYKGSLSEADTLFLASFSVGYFIATLMALASLEPIKWE